MSYVKTEQKTWKAIKPHRSMMILEKNRLLQTLYTEALEAHNWRVMGCMATTHELIELFEKCSIKPELLLLDYDKRYYPDLLAILEKILSIHPSQYLLFVSNDKRLLHDETFLPPFLREVPVILKTTLTVEDLVHDLDYLPDYVYTNLHCFT